MKVVFSDQAQADLESIGDWIARDAPRRAVSFVQELRRLCHSFGAHPRRAPVARMMHGCEIRRAVHGSYLIYFQVDDGQDEVGILRIVHGARDQNAVFSNGPDGEAPE